MKYIYLISEIGHFFCGIIFFLWAYTKPVHKLMIKRTGIRIVTTESNLKDGKNDIKEVYDVLLLLERFDNESLDLIKKHIKTIFLCPIGVEAGYYPIGHICVLNLKIESDEKSLIRIAGLLVFVANFSKLNGRLIFSPGQRQENIRRDCKKEQHRIIEKLRNAMYSA